MGPLFEDLVEEASPMAENAGLDLRFVPTHLSVVADPDFLQSILRNFLSNARRYTHEGGIVLGARRRGENVTIEVWDSGPGISEEKQGLIFEEFQRFQDVDNSGIRGAGLGLSVAKRMAELMSAKLGLESVIGKGSVFSVTLKRAETRSNRYIIPSKKFISRADELTGLTVLCIDDEATILEGMRALLSRWDCNCLLYTSPSPRDRG